MKAVILAGGLGTRISEETHLRPKPMIEIGGFPILWHIMKIYSFYNIKEFIICCGYKGYLIKEFFSNYLLHTSDVTLNLEDNKIEFHKKRSESWKVTLVDTGQETMTGGRLKRVKEYIGEETFCFTYGDGLSDINISELIEFHKENKKLATLAAVKPKARFGSVEFNSLNKVTKFHEKPPGGAGWVSGGFFVLEPAVIDLIDNDDTIWEREPLEHLVKNENLLAYPHQGFWQPMDTLRDKNYLEELWSSNNAIWKKW